jgi:hypothetical protein
MDKASREQWKEFKREQEMRFRLRVLKRLEELNVAHLEGKEQIRETVIALLSERGMGFGDRKSTALRVASVLKDHEMSMRDVDKWARQVAAPVIDDLIAEGILHKRKRAPRGEIDLVRSQFWGDTPGHLFDYYEGIRHEREALRRY